MKRFLLSIFAVMLCMSIHAQVIYENGWFADNNGNRTECLIRNDEKFCSASGIRYRMSSEGEDRAAAITEVSSFFVGGMLFERHEVDIDTSENTLTAGVGYDIEPVFVKKTVFLQVLCDGPARLYYYRVPNTKDNFFFSTESNPELQYLVNKRYLTDGRTGYLRENHTFRNQLYSVFVGKVSADDLKNTSYTETDLIRVFDQFNGTESAVRRSGRLNLDIRASYRPAKQSGLYGAGLSLEYVMPFNRNKWAVLASFDAKVYDITDPEVSDSDKNCEGFYPQFRVGARYYMYLHKSVSMYLDGEFAIGQFDRTLLGAGFKFFNCLGVGVQYSLPLGILLPNVKPDHQVFFPEKYPAVPLNIYFKASIPLMKEKGKK